MAVSAVLDKVGVSADSGTVLTLANQGYDTHHPGGPAQELFQENPTAVSLPETRLVHWPSIVDFLEDGLDGQVEACAIRECKKRQLRSNSPEKASQSKAPRLINGEQKIPTSADTGKDSLPRAGEEKYERSDPETTPESSLGIDGGLSKGGGARSQSEANDSCHGSMLVKQGLLTIDAGLRELKFDRGGLSPSQIADTMDSVRDILEVKAGIECGRGGNCRVGADEKPPQIKEILQGSPEGTIPENESKTVPALVGTERLVQAACMAGKRGDVTALRVRAVAANKGLLDRHRTLHSRLLWHITTGRSN